MSERVLVVEDDPVLQRGIVDNFVVRGYSVETACDGESGLEKALGNDADLIILDVMLPGINGYEICRCLRREGIATPTIFLTAKAEESDILLGLGLGADDYMSKPFSIRELLARAEAVLRRSAASGGRGGGGSADAGRFAFGGLVLDQEAHKLRRQCGEEVPLSPKEYRLLVYFLERRGKALSRGEIMAGVWGRDCAVTPRSIDRFVTTLRRKIEIDPARPQHIETVREFGYRFRRGEAARGD